MFPDGRTSTSSQRMKSLLRPAWRVPLGDEAARVGHPRRDRRRTIGIEIEDGRFQAGERGQPRLHAPGVGPREGPRRRHAVDEPRQVVGRREGSPLDGHPVVSHHCGERPPLVHDHARPFAGGRSPDRSGGEQEGDGQSPETGERTTEAAARMAARRHPVLTFFWKRKGTSPGRVQSGSSRVRHNRSMAGRSARIPSRVTPSGGGRSAAIRS